MRTGRDTAAESLARGAAALRLALTAAQQAKLLAYLDLLAKWNRAYNLTAVREPSQMIARHLLDSLAVLPYLQGPRVLDVGSGAGLPGIPLAIALPGAQFVLLDSVAKKTRFLLQAAGELGLANIRIETLRVEQYHPAELFDTVIARAFASLAEFIALAGALCRPGGRLLAMKGRYPEDELAAVPQGFRLKEVARLAVPSLTEERHVVRVDRHPSS